MEITFTKGETKDYIKAVRDDGSIVETTFPKKGWYPHDAVHVIVEKHFNLQNGFWGIVAAGMAPEDVGELAKKYGHASASRAEIPDNKIRELIFAERAVECYEAELWGTPSDIGTFRSVLEAACASSFIEMPNIDDATILNARDDLLKSANKWKELSSGQSMTMIW